jgi:3-carboxy-cis,cis-muconate cycloisomerase
MGAQLHLAAAEVVDERSDGAWHTEWATLRTLARRTVVAAAQTSELVTGLQVDVERMRANADAAADDLLAEARSLAGDNSGVSFSSPGEYLGANDLLIDAAVRRGRGSLEGTR